MEKNENSQMAPFSFVFFYAYENIEKTMSLYRYNESIL